MATLYTIHGKRVEISHAIDVIDAIQSGNYFEKNPIGVKKVDPIAEKQQEHAERGRPKKLPFETIQPVTHATGIDTSGEKK